MSLRSRGNERKAQVIVITSFLTVLIMLSIAFVAYSAAIFNTKPFFDDYTAVGLNFRSASDALTRHLLANLTAWARSQGKALTLNMIQGYVNSKIVALLNAFTVSFANTVDGKSLSIKIVPPSTYVSPPAALYNGTAINWPGRYPASLSAVGYSLASYRYYLNITSDSLFGYTFSSTALLLVNVTSHSKPDTNTITLKLQANNEADFELNLDLLTVSTHTNAGWTDHTADSNLFSYVNGSYTVTVTVPSSSAVDQVSFSLFNPSSVIVFMNSTV